MVIEKTDNPHYPQGENSQPIGVFDSGVGGISVLKELVLRMPYENYIYYGDSANAPYGEKSHDEIISLTESAVNKLSEKKIKALVVACNTATGVAIEAIRKRYSFPVIGLEPALKPAVENSRGGRIIVTATHATLREEKFRRLFEKYGKNSDIVLLPATGIVRYVEGNGTREELTAFLDGIFRPWRDGKTESVVLGCTHFPFVRKEIRAAAGENVIIYDGGKGAAAETERRLKEAGLTAKNTEGKTGSVRFENSFTDRRNLITEELMRDLFFRDLD